MVLYPADSIPLHQAYWHVAGELDPLPHPLPVTNDESTKIDFQVERSHHEMREKLGKLEKHLRLSLAGYDPMTGERPTIALQPFIVHPETHVKLIAGINWFDPNESISVLRVVSVNTANGKVDCPILLDLSNVEQWRDAMRNRFALPQTPKQTQTENLPDNRKRGVRAWKMPGVLERMRADLNEGKLTTNQLRAKKEKELSSEYEASRDTARKARKQVLSENVERQIATNDK